MQLCAEEDNSRQSKKVPPRCCNHAPAKFLCGQFAKLVKDVQTAIRLLYSIIGMCANGGGFTLTKIISNRVEVLQSVTETERKSVKNVDINNGIDLPTERALRFGQETI